MFKTNFVVCRFITLSHKYNPMKTFILTASLICCSVILITACSAESEEITIMDLPELILSKSHTITESDELLLGSITALHADSEGNLILTDTQQRYVHAVDPLGNFIQTIGARGSGPGEYQFPGLVTTGTDDSVHILDWSTRNVSTFSKSDGGWVFSSNFPVDFSATGFYSSMFATAPDAFYAVTRPNVFTDEDGLSVVMQVGLDGTVERDSVFTFPPPEQFTMMQDGMPRMSTTNPLMHRQGRITDDYAGNLYFGWTDSLYIKKKEAGANSFKLHISLDLPVREFTSVIGDSLMNSFANMLEGNNQARRDFRESFPETLPAFNILMADDLGYLWVSVFDTDGKPEWIIFDADGNPVYKTTLDDGYRLGALRHGNAYLISTDDDGLPLVTVMEYSY